MYQFFRCLIVYFVMLMASPSWSAPTTVQSLIGKEDIKYWDGKNSSFSRRTSTGGSLSLTPVDSAGSVDALYAYGGGTARTLLTIKTACSSIGTSTNAALLLSSGSWEITDDYIIPGNIRVIMAEGAYFSVSSGKKLTFASPNQITAANNQQIFDGEGTVAFTIPGVVWVGWWGANEDATDAAGTKDAIQAAITAAAPVPESFTYDDQSKHAGTVKLACGHYLIDEPLVIPSNVVGLSIEGECGAMHGFGQTIIQWAGATMSDTDDWMIDAGSVMGFRLSRLHLIGNADDSNASSATIQNGVFVRRVDGGFFASGNMWEDVTIRRFPGIGVQFGDYTVQNSGTGEDSTNTDNSYIKNLMISDCRVGLVIDSPNFVQVFFNRLLIYNTPSVAQKFKTKNAVQILHGKLHVVDFHPYASYVDGDAYSQYAIYALNGSFEILSGYSEAQFLAYVANGSETQGQQEVNSISNFHFFPGEAGGPATAGKYPIYYAKSYIPLLMVGTKGIWVMEASTSAGVISVGCQVPTKFLSRYTTGENWWEEFTRNPNSHDWGLMTTTINGPYNGNYALRYNVSSQIGAAGTSFDSPDGKTFRLLNNLIRSTYVDEYGAATTVYYVSPAEETPGATTKVNFWDFGNDGIRGRHLLAVTPQSHMTEAQLLANDYSQVVYSSSPGTGELNLYNGWAEYDGNRKVGFRFGLDRRQITFWGELNGSSATADAILVIGGTVDCSAIGLSDGEKFHVVANGNGKFLPLSFTCGTSEGADYLTLAHADWPEDENSARCDRVSLDGITIFVK